MFVRGRKIAEQAKPWRGESNEKAEGQGPPLPGAESSLVELSSDSRLRVAEVVSLGARLGGPYRGLRLGLLGLLLAGAYIGLGHLGLGFALDQQRSTIIWAPSGLAIAAVWIFGNRVLWAVYLGAFVTNVIAGPGLTPLALLLSALISLGNAGEAWLAGWLVRRYKLDDGIRGTRDVGVYFLTVVLAATLLSALNGMLWLVLFDDVPLAQAPMDGIIWWLGDVGGVLVVTSVAIASLQRRVGESASLRPSALRLDPSVVAMTVIAAAFVAIGPWVKTGANGNEAAAAASVLCLVLPYPASALAALRLGLRGACVVTATIALAAVIGTAAGAGPFQTGDARIDVVSLWPLLATLSISAMLLAATFEERLSATAQRSSLECELQRRRSLGELGLMTGGIAHDFNNILTVIQANTKLMDGADAGMRAECARDIEEATIRGKELTEQLLAYAGRRNVARQRFDVSALASETARLLTSHCPPGVELALELAQGAMVDGEPVQMRQVLMNLLMNAFDAMRGRKGKITLTIAIVGDWVTLTVTDQGPGIPAEVRVRVFEPFFTTKTQGHGMGLAAVQGIVTAHGGTIAIDQPVRGVKNAASEVGNAALVSPPPRPSAPGARVRVQLPSSPSLPSARPKPGAAIEPGAKGGRVLVVDDEPGVRRLTALILQRAGFEVTVAEGAKDALTMAAKSNPQVALLDVKLGPESGLDVMQLLRAQHPGLHVILMSGFHEQRIDPSIPILEKPFDPEDLVSAVTRAVRPAA